MEWMAYYGQKAGTLEYFYHLDVLKATLCELLKVALYVFSHCISAVISGIIILAEKLVFQET